MHTGPKKPSFECRRYAIMPIPIHFVRPLAAVIVPVTS